MSRKIVCKHCYSSNLKFSKHIHEGDIEKSFHYKIKCKDCKKSYYVPRSKKIFQLVKDQAWILSRNAKKKLKLSNIEQGEELIGSSPEKPTNNGLA